MIVLVTYDLKNSDRDYTPFYDQLKEQGTWWHYLKSTWLLNTTKQPGQIADALRPLMDESDNLFVTEITKNNSGWLSKKAWDWISRHET
jgi:hypothetical protein